MGGYYDPPLGAECQISKKTALSLTAPRGTDVENRPTFRQHFTDISQFIHISYAVLRFFVAFLRKNVTMFVLKQKGEWLWWRSSLSKGYQ